MKVIKIFLCVLALGGCVVLPINSSYKVSKVYVSKSTNLTVGILPFVDNRQDENTSYSTSCAVKTLIPAWFYCTKYHLNDSARTDFDHFLESMRNALAKDLKTNKMFSNVVLAENKNADIYITATVNEYSLTKKNTTYGISVLGYLVGLFGTPMGWADNKVNITYTVRNKNGQELLKRNYTHEAARVYGYYYPSVISMGASFKPINDDFFRDLSKVLK